MFRHIKLFIEQLNVPELNEPEHELYLYGPLDKLDGGMGVTTTLVSPHRQRNIT